MHPEVKTYCESIKAKFPEYFKDKNVLDVGSLDINGNNRYLFEGGTYIGIDLGEGPNVDKICDISIPEEYSWVYETIISTEMLEHCKGYTDALINMTKLLKPNGLLLITAAGEGRPEHGTTQSDPESAPFTNNHYKNILPEDFDCIIDQFNEYEISTINNDIRFYGIKK